MTRNPYNAGTKDTLHNISAKAFIQSRIVLQQRGSALANRCETMIIDEAKAIEAARAKDAR